MDFQELAKQRYSVRRYAPEAVGAVALNMVLEAALVGLISKDMSRFIPTRKPLKCLVMARNR